MMKICSKCKQKKECIEFNKSSRNKDGLYSSCIICRKGQYKQSYKSRRKIPIMDEKTAYEKQLKKAREWKRKNREHLNKYMKNVYPKYKQTFILNARIRGKRLKKSTPKWADMKQIKEFYKNCPKGYHVDHIIPIKGKNVCGLHIIENLQYLPAAENQKKGNRF